MGIDLNSYVILIRNRKVLVVQEKGRKLFSLPGGGVRPGESSKKGLVRELEEEIGIKASEQNLTHYNTFLGPTGRKNRLKAKCFLLKVKDVQLKPSEGIEKTAWVGIQCAQKYNLSLILKKKILPSLFESGIVS